MLANRIDNVGQVSRRSTSPPALKRLEGAALILATLLAVAGPSHAQTVSPRRLLEVVDLGNPVISPDGRRVAFRLEQASIERNTYDTVWYVQDLGATAPPRRVADGGVPLREYSTGLVLSAPAVWSPDGRWIFYRALLDGKIAVWQAAADGSEARPVTSDPADIREFSLSADGRTLTYSVGATREEVIAAEQAEYDLGIRIDNTAFIGAGVFRSSQLEGRLATQRFVGNWFTPGPLLAHAPGRWKAVDLLTLTTREIPQSEVPPGSPKVSDLPEELTPSSILAPDPKGGRIAILTRVGEKEGLLARPDVELAVLPNRSSTRPIKCLAELCTNKNITNIQWRPNSDEVLFTVTDRQQGRARSIFLWNVSSGFVRPVVHARGTLSGGQRYWDMPCGLSSETLVCVATEADQPPRLEAIDLATGRRQVLFDPNSALAEDIAATVPAKLIRWTDVRGREFTGQLFEALRADGVESPPLFVTFYTCDGFLRGGLGDEWPLASLAESGISAICVNGNPGYVDVAEHYGQGLLAVEGLVDLLSARGEIDRTRVGMGGLSYGGEATMWTVMNSDLLAAASVASPSISPSWYLFNSLRENFRSVVRTNWQLGAPEETPDQWRAISPVFNLNKIQVPILFQMPEQEYLVALDYVIPLIRRQQADLYVFPYEPHIKFQPRHKLAVYERNVDWFRFWLQDYEDPDPTKREQYAHWRLMRERNTEH